MRSSDSLIRAARCVSFDSRLNSEEWKDSMKRKVATNKSRIRGMSA
jgi:hypothetical protein